MADLSELYRVAPFEADVFAARFSPGGGYLALGLGDGTVSLHHGRTGKALAHVPATTAGTRSGATAAPATMGLPITALRWRPEAAAQFRVSEATTAKDVLLAAGSDGVIRHIHANSGRVLSTIVDEGTQIFACDYRGDAQRFATVGNTKSVKVYDEETRAVVADMSGGSQLPGLSPYDFQQGGAASSRRASAGAAEELPSLGTGHSNRIFSVAWHPSEGDGNILATGGWDNTVQIWDVRANCAVRSIYGPHLGGDGLAFTPDGRHLLTASWRTKNQLQLWDWARGALALTLPWAESNADCAESIAESSALARHPNQAYDGGGARLYGLALSPSGALLLAGGSGVNEAKVFSVPEMHRLSAARGAPCAGAGALVATITGLERGVFAMDWCSSGSSSGSGEGATLVVAGGDAPTRVLQLRGAEGAGWPARREEGSRAGSAVWGHGGDALLLDYAASPDPNSPVRPPRRVLKAQAAAFAAAAAGGAAGAGAGAGSSSSSSSAAAAGGGGGATARAVSGSPTPEERAGAHPVVSLLSPGPKSLRKGSAAMRAVGQAREMNSAAVGGGGGAPAPAAAGAVEEEEEEDGEEEEEAPAEEAPKGFLSRL